MERNKNKFEEEELHALTNGGPGDDKGEESLTFDGLLVEVGEWGRYQCLTLWLLIIPACFMNAYNGFALVFVAYTPPHTCTLNTNSTCETISENGTLEQCSDWDYDTTYFRETLITRFDLVCERELVAKNVMMAVQTMAVVGCLLYAWIMDRWGRRLAFHLNVLTYVVGSVGSVLMPSVNGFAAFRLISGLNKLSTFNIGYIWVVEVIGPSKRTMATALMCFMYGIAMASLSLIAYVCSDYVQLGLAVSAPFLLLFSYHFIIMESPRWLLSEGRLEEAESVLRRMMKFNGDEKKDVDVNKLLHRVHQKENNGETANLLDLFRGPTLRMKTLIVTLVFISTAVSYVTLSFYTEHLKGNLYLIWALMSIVEAPPSLLNIIIIKIDTFGRIRPMAFGSILAGLCCLAAGLAEEAFEWLAMSFAVAGKFWITLTYAIIYQAGGELMPTPVRGLGIGFASTIGDGFNIAFPYIIYSGSTIKILPMLIMAVVAAGGGLAALFLPETLNLPMAQSLEDAEVYGEVSWRSFRRNITLRKTPAPPFKTPPPIPDPIA